MYRSTKTYGNDRGLSCVFRQYLAKSHCNLLHGYSLGFKFIFAAEQLDEQNFVVDFGKGGFGEIKEWLHYMFDHTLLVAEDDPLRSELERLGQLGLAEVRIIPASGCESTARLVLEQADKIIRKNTKGRCWVESVEVFEHGSNSGIYTNEKFTPYVWNDGSYHFPRDVIDNTKFCTDYNIK